MKNKKVINGFIEGLRILQPHAIQIYLNEGLVVVDTHKKLLDYTNNQLINMGWNVYTSNDVIQYLYEENKDNC